MSLICLIPANCDQDLWVTTSWCVPACGLANRMERIVGGWATHVNEYPWVLALTINGKFYCGATLINDLYALTAAHCVQ